MNKNAKLYELLNRLEDILIDIHNDACSLPGHASPETHPPPTTHTPPKSTKIMFIAWDAIKLLSDISNIIGGKDHEKKILKNIRD